MGSWNDLGYSKYWKRWRRSTRRLSSGNPLRAKLDFVQSSVVHKRGLLLIAADLRRLSEKKENEGGSWIIKYQDLGRSDVQERQTGNFSWERNQLLALAESQWFEANILLEIAEKMEELADGYPDFSKEWKALSYKEAEGGKA